MLPATRLAPLDERDRWYVIREAASLARILIESGCEAVWADADERGLNHGLDLVDHRDWFSLGRRMAEIDMRVEERLRDRDLATGAYAEWPILTEARSRYRNGEGE